MHPGREVGLGIDLIWHTAKAIFPERTRPTRYVTVKTSTGIA